MVNNDLVYPHIIPKRIVFLSGTKHQSHHDGKAQVNDNVNQKDAFFLHPGGLQNHI